MSAVVGFRVGVGSGCLRDLNLLIRQNLYNGNGKTILLYKQTLTHNTMVQGTTKGLQTKASSNARRTHKAAANTKKGRRNVAPKKGAAIQQASMHKVGIALIFNLLYFLSLFPHSLFIFSITLN